MYSFIANFASFSVIITFSSVCLLPPLIYLVLFLSAYFSATFFSGFLLESNLEVFIFSSFDGPFFLGFPSLVRFLLSLLAA
jgi:hypothetical protein